MKRVVLLSPAANPRNDESFNLGDKIIMHYFLLHMAPFLKGFRVKEIPIHTTIGLMDQLRIATSSYTFLVGANSLITHIDEDKRLNFRYLLIRRFILFRRKIIFVGVGLDIYRKIGEKGKTLYSRILSREIYHSVRDNRTKIELSALKNDGLLIHNTGCPTTWGLTKGWRETLNCDALYVLTSLTNYSENVQDLEMLKFLFSLKGRVVLVPSHFDDVNRFVKYCEILNEINYEILPVDLSLIISWFRKHHNDSTYVGNRLHVGMLCLNFSIPSVVISVSDGRATNLLKNINYPVFERKGLIFTRKNLNKKYYLNIRHNIINKWKLQFQ